MKSCTQCLKEKDISAFIDKRNGTETLLCSRFRERSDLHNKHKKYKEDMGVCDIYGLDAPMKDFDHTGEEKTCRVMDCKTELSMEFERYKCRVLCRKCHVKMTSLTRNRKQVSTDRRKQNKYDRINRNVTNT